MAVVEVEEFTAEEEADMVGPIMRVGSLAEAMIDAIEEDNPESDVFVLDRDDYIRIHTTTECRLRRETLARHVGKTIDLNHVEVEMPSFKGRLETRVDQYRWYYKN